MKSENKANKFISIKHFTASDVYCNEPQRSPIKTGTFYLNKKALYVANTSGQRAGRS